MPFNHNQVHAGNGVFTSPYSPWSAPGLPGSSAPPPSATFSPPSVVPDNVTYPDPGSPSTMLPVFLPGWPQPLTSSNGPSFEAVHMAVIPKGPYRGHVLVWNIEPVKAFIHPPGLPSTVPAIPSPGYQCYQAYAIVDPADVPLGGIRYRNFLVPIGPPVPQPGSTIASKDLFCSGHAWSPYGDLIVAGGTDFDLASGVITFAGGRLTYAFNPAFSCFWPDTGYAYYPATAGTVINAGMWVKGPDLQVARWYATVTMTHGLDRDSLSGTPGVAINKERAVILGGSEAVPPTTNDRANRTYEALVVLGEAQPGVGASNLKVDQFPGQLLSFSPTSAQQDRVWDGPVITGIVNTDWLYEYPRTFLLSTGQLFVCGYAPRSGWLDHETDPGIWLQAGTQPGLPSGSYSSNWQNVRHDGSAVLFPNLGLNADVVLRVGGGTDYAGATTDTVETIAANAVGNTWAPESAMPITEPGLPDGGRLFTNLVTLPTGDLLLLGGQWQNGGGGVTKLSAPMLFSAGKWTKMPPNPVSSPRTYHSTAVLLPDGRVFLGGGDDRLWDYEIFSPPYLNSPLVRPTNLAWQAPVPIPEPVTGALELNYSGTYEVHCAPLPVGHAVVKAVLTAPCSVTHHSDMHQRYVEIDVSVRRGNEVTFKVPPDDSAAPRGIYMLWLVTNTGTPSVAEWVVLR